MSPHRVFAIATLFVLVSFGFLSIACGGSDDDAASPATSPVSSAITQVAQGQTPPAATATTAAGQGGGNETNGTTVAVTEKDYSIAPVPASVASGAVTFHIQNNGPTTHEFVVFKTDLAADKLPLDDSGGEVDEDADSVDHIDEVEDLAAGDTKDLTVDLQSGHYVLICNITGHYLLGMHTEFTVK